MITCKLIKCRCQMDFLGQCSLTKRSENWFPSISLRWKMSNIWFPLPVALFLRRVVNIISTLSITHHYLFPFPPRPTGADTDNSVECLLSPSSPWASRVLPYPNGPRQEAVRHVLPWATIVESGFLDRILQGMKVLPKLPLEPRSDFLRCT